MQLFNLQPYKTMQLPESFPAIIGDQVVRVSFTAQPVIGVEKVIQQFAIPPSVRIGNIGHTNATGNPTAMVVAGENLVILMSRVQLVFNTYWIPSSIPTSDNQPDDQILAATFRANQGELMSFPWEPPGITFIWACTFVNVGNFKFQHEHSYLVAATTGNKIIYKPPVPNINTTGLVCHGNEWNHPSQNLGMTEAFDQDIRWMQNSRWNRDLVTDDFSPEEFIRVYPNGKTAPPSRPIASAMRPVNDAVTEQIAKFWFQIP